jgi:pimeloyl-ACP methyl ester carboxylesterase
MVAVMPGNSTLAAQSSRYLNRPEGRVEPALAVLSAPTPVVMGEQDPDFPEPRAEADSIADALHGQVVMVPDAGHYPQSQRADVTTPAVVRFVETVHTCA